eukprot:4337957-Prymnesium_polylepis.1
MVAVTGPCVLSGGCIQSSGYPSSNYGTSESCTVTQLPAVPLHVVAFDVEEYGCSFDFMTINGDVYCGTTGPDGVVPLDGRMAWTSDDLYAFSGWKVCFVAPPRPPAFPPLPPLLPPQPPSPPSPPSPPPPLSFTLSCGFSTPACADMSIGGDATIVSDYLRLNPNLGGQNGWVSFDIPSWMPVRSVTVSMSLYIGSDSGADGVGVVFGGAVHNSGRTWEAQVALETPGFHWGISEYSDRSVVSSWSGNVGVAAQTRPLPFLERQVLFGGWISVSIVYSE